MDVDPNAEPVFLAQRAVGHLDRDLPILILALLDKNLRVRPAAIAVNYPELPRKLRMWFHEQRFEEFSVRLYLSLELIVDLRA